MHWLQEQIYHFNILGVLAVVLIVSISQVMESTKVKNEIKSIAGEVYKNTEEIKDEIRNTRRHNGSD